MTKNILLDFQVRATHELAIRMVKTWVRSKNNPKYTLENPLVLSSPTGSGKTVMVANTMQTFKNKAEQILQESSYDYNEGAKEILDNFDDLKPLYVFVSPSAGGLDSQSADKLQEEGSEQQELAEELLNVVHWDSVTPEGHFDENTVLVISWDKVNRENNRSRKQTESSTTTTFDLITRKARRNRPLIMFVDESHKNDTNKSKEVIEAFRPDILIKVSATPKESAESTGQTTQENAVMVGINEVRKEKLIKDSVEVITHRNGTLFNRDSVIENAIEMQKELENALDYEDIRRDVPEIPLVLIQIENDKKTDTGKSNAEQVRDKLLKEGIPENQIAIWLTDKDGQGKVHIDPTLPEKIPNHIRYLIFKTAIATGWDCPRSHILVKLRNVGSQTLDIQTIGRIVRKANNKIGVDNDYDNDILKPAYIFVENGISATDFSDETQGLLGNFILTEASMGNIKDKFQSDVAKFNSVGFEKDIKVKSKTELSRLTHGKLKKATSNSLDKALEAHMGELRLEEKATLQVSKNSTETVEELFSGKLSEVDTETAVFEKTQDEYDYFMRELAGKLKDRHLIDTIVDSLNKKGTSKRKRNKRSFMNILINHDDLVDLLEENDLDVTEETVIALFINNQEFFNTFANTLISEYKEVVKVETIKQKIDYFIPSTVPVNNASDDASDNYLYTAEPDFSEESSIEKAFAEHLRNNKDVKWWFKNQRNGINAFGLYFTDDNDELTGYFPDFIFETKDNELFIIDTKSGDIDSNIDKKYKAGLDYADFKQNDVMEHFRDFVFSLVMKDKHGNFVYCTGNSFKQPQHNPDYWEQLSF